MDNDHKENPDKKNTQACQVAAVFATSALSLSLSSCVTPEDLAALADVPNQAQNPNNWQTITKPNNSTTNKPQVLPPAPNLQNATRFTDAQAIQKYSLSRYTYIDAKVLANYWGERSPYSAKVRLGHKMLDFGLSNGSVHVNAARTTVLRKPERQWPVNFMDGGYNFSDAVLLGRYWGRGTGGAKTKMARHLIQGKDQWNKAALRAARAGNY